jgi:hypothetical protein
MQVPESVIINNFNSKTGVEQRVAEQLLTGLVAFTLVTGHFMPTICFVNLKDAKVPAFRDGTIVPSFWYTVVQSTLEQSRCSVDKDLRLHGKISRC